MTRVLACLPAEKRCPLFLETLQGSGFRLAPASGRNCSAGIAAYEAGDMDQALVLLRPEAEAGNIQAQFLLGQMLGRRSGANC